MGTNKVKQEICWGLRWWPANPAQETPEFITEMRITSFSINASGTLMAHGSDANTGQSIHRRVDTFDMFYPTKKQMKDAILRYTYISTRHVRQQQQLLNDMAELLREQKIERGQLLGKGSFTPLELSEFYS